MHPEHDKKNSVLLFSSKNFICFGMDLNKIIIQKVNSHNVYDPSLGWLLFDVSIYKNTLLNSLSIIGKKYKIYTPPKNLFYSKFSLISNDIFANIKDINEKHIYFSFGKYKIIKRQYYYFKEIEQINRCFFDVPMIILNCLDDKEAVNNGTT